MPQYMISRIVLQLFTLYYYILILRIFLTWIPNVDMEQKPLCWLRAITDPFLNIFRGIIPPIGGMLDISPILAFLALWLFQTIAINILSGLGL